MSSIDLVMMNRQLSDNPLYVYNGNGDRYDISTEPVMCDQYNIYDMVGSPLLNRDKKDFGMYMYNGIKVPRVTSILKYCQGDRDFLLKWAAKLGDKYTEQSQNTLDIGTKVHEAIAEYLTSGTLFSIKNIRQGRNEVYNCLKNFMAWYNKVTIDLGWKVDIFLSEAPLICPWFGGTCDAIMIINGKRYVVDFKSSKKLSSEYFVQVSAYKWIIDNYYPQYGPIDGVGLLRFDKERDAYEDIFLEVSNPEDVSYIYHCQQIFWLALNMYYNMNVFESETSIMKDEKKAESNKGKISEDHKKNPVRKKKYKKKR